jgi:hypothetical protein
MGILNVRDLSIFVVKLHLVCNRKLVFFDTQFSLPFGHQIGRIVGLELPGGKTCLIHLLCSKDRQPSMVRLNTKMRLTCSISKIDLPAVSGTIKNTNANLLKLWSALELRTGVEQVMLTLLSKMH